MDPTPRDPDGPAASRLPPRRVLAGPRRRGEGAPIVLDADLRVGFANRSFFRAFVVDPAATEGRPIDDLGDRRWDIPGLRTLLEDALPGRPALDDYEIDREFERIGRRTMIPNARWVAPGDRADPLILIAVEDAAEGRRAATQVRECEARLRHIFESVEDFSIFATDPAGVVIHRNAGAENVVGHPEVEMIGRTAAVVFAPEDRARGIPEREMENAIHAGRGTDERWHLEERRRPLLRQRYGHAPDRRRGAAADRGGPAAARRDRRGLARLHRVVGGPGSRPSGTS